MLRGLSAEKRAIFTELTSLSMIAASFCLFYALILMVKNNIKQLVIRQMCMLIMQKECLCRFFNFVNFLTSDRDNGPRSIYQYSNMAPRLSSQTSIFGVVFFVSKSLLWIEGQRKLEKFAILTRKPRSHARILIYRTWPIKYQYFSHLKKGDIFQFDYNVLKLKKK